MSRHNESKLSIFWIFLKSVVLLWDQLAVHLGCPQAKTFFFRPFVTIVSFLMRNLLKALSVVFFWFLKCLCDHKRFCHHMIGVIIPVRGHHIFGLHNT